MSTAGMLLSGGVDAAGYSQCDWVKGTECLCQSLVAIDDPRWCGGSLVVAFLPEDCVECDGSEDNHGSDDFGGSGGFECDLFVNGHGDGLFHRLEDGEKESGEEYDKEADGHAVEEGDLLGVPPAIADDPRTEEPFEGTVGDYVEADADGTKVTRGARGEEAKDKDGEDTGRDKALELLDVGKDAGEVVQFGSDKSGEEDEEDDKCTADFNEFGGVFLSAEFGVEVHRSDGGGGVEHGGE